PGAVKKVATGGRDAILVQSGAGVAASVLDKDFEAAGAKIVPGARDLSAADIVLKVRGPQDGEVGLFKRGAILVGLLNPYDRATMESYAGAGLTGFAMEWLPRTTRAQSMDALSSQANIGGYKAVILAANEYGRFMPMLMTADITSTTALIPGRPAPVLLKEETVRAMKPGSVVVDMAIEQGGNCPLTEKDKIVVKHGVKLIGISNLPALVAADASALYARNLLNFLALLLDPKTGELKLDRSDEIIAGSLVCING